MEMEMQLNDLTTAPSRAHLCVLLALREAGAALREPYPPPDATATTAPPVDSPANRARRLPIADQSNEPPAPTGPPPCCQKRKSHSEPFSQQRFTPECEHMHAEHAKLRNSRASEALDSFTGYTIRRSASDDSLSALRGLGSALGGLSSAVALYAGYTTTAPDAAALARQEHQRQAAAVLQLQENAVPGALLPASQTPPRKQPSHTSASQSPEYIEYRLGSISPRPSASRHPPNAQNTPPKLGVPAPPSQRYSGSLSTFSNLWHTGGVPRPGSAELASSFYAACSTCMSLRGTHSLMKAPQPPGGAPLAPRQPIGAHESSVATGGAGGPCSHTPTSSSNSSMSRALDQEEHARPSPDACSGAHPQPCMREGSEHSGDLLRSKQYKHGSESLAGGHTDLREAMAKLQDVVQLGTYGDYAVLPVHQFLTPVKTKCKSRPPSQQVRPPSQQHRPHSQHHVHRYPIDELSRLPRHPSPMRANASIFDDDMTSSPLSSFPSFISSSQSFPMTPTHELAESMALPAALRQRIPFSPPVSGDHYSDTRGFSHAAARFASCLIPSPPKLSKIYNSQDISEFNDTQWTPEGSACSHGASSAHRYGDSHLNPFYQREQESLAPLPPTQQPGDCSTSPKISCHPRSKRAAAIDTERSAFPESPYMSASESEMARGHGGIAPCPVVAGQLPGDSACSVAAAESASHRSWRQNSRRHSFVLDSKKIKEHESPRSNEFCPPATCDASDFEARALSRRVTVDDTVTYFERQVSKSGLVSQSSGGRPGGSSGGLLLPRGPNSNTKLAAGVQAGTGGNAKAGGTRRKSLQLLRSIRDRFVGGARGSAAAAKTPGAKSRKKNLKAESRSFNVVKSQSSRSKVEIDASGASAPCVIGMHDDGDDVGGGAAVEQQRGPEVNKSTKKQRHSFSASMGLTSLWKKPLRDSSGIQGRRSQGYSTVQAPVREESSSTAAVLELESAEASHDAEEPMHVKKRWNFQSFTRSKAAADAPAVQHRLGKQAWGSPAVDHVHVGPDTSQHAAHRTQRKARSFQHTDAVPAAHNHSMQGIDEASAIQNPDSVDQFSNFSPLERSVAMRAQLAQQSQRELHTEMGESKRSGSVDHAQGIGRHGKSTDGAAPARATRMSLDVGKFFRGMRTPSMHASRPMHAGNVAASVAGVEGKGAGFGRGSFEAGPAGNYRRMQASWRSCVFPLMESDTETSSPES